MEIVGATNLPILDRQNKVYKAVGCYYQVSFL